MMKPSPRRASQLGLSLMLAAALTASLAPAARAAGSNETVAPDGSLQVPYGHGEPTLTCQPLFVCDLALQDGESVINIAVGDSVRWVIASAQSGPNGATPHIFLKPTRANLYTNLVVTTNKRVYYVRLVSAPIAPNPRLSFTYPEEAAATQAKQDDILQQELTEGPELPLGSASQLDSKYRMVGAPEIMPARTYNDGAHTFIEFAALPTDLPVVYSVAQDGSQQIVNFRLRDRTFVIDGIQSGFNLVLNGGTGHHGHGQRTVYIRHL